jgi:hypothetical protein
MPKGLWGGCVEENFKRRRVEGDGLLGNRPRLRVVAVIAGFALVALGWAFVSTAEPPPDFRA